MNYESRIISKYNYIWQGKMGAKTIKQFKFLRPYFWSYKKGISPKKDEHLIIHQVLAHGAMDDIRRLLKIYGKKKVRKEFQKPEKGLYHPEILNLCQFLLGIKKLNKNKYLKNIHG